MKIQKRNYPVLDRTISNIMKQYVKFLANIWDNIY